jgi:hypothetical protein
VPKFYAECSVCWCAGRTKWEKLLRLAACAVICLMAMLPYAFAHTEFPPVGSPGGDPFRVECPPGQYLVGVRWRSGSWMDQISPTCVFVDAQGFTGPHWHGPTFGGTGGAPHEDYCPPAAVINFASILLQSDTQYVHMMDLSCRRTISNTPVWSLTNIGAPSSVFGDHNQSCPPGEAVMGIQGRAGLYVDAIGMICDALPVITPSRPEPPPEACRGPGDPVPAQWSDMLSAHNERRKQHCVAPLTWSNELALACPSLR